jgi:hypothetical protein
VQPLERVIVVTCRASVGRAGKTGQILKKFESVQAIGYQPELRRGAKREDHGQILTI